MKLMRIAFTAIAVIVSTEGIVYATCQCDTGSGHTCPVDFSSPHELWAGAPLIGFGVRSYNFDYNPNANRWEIVFQGDSDDDYDPVLTFADPEGTIDSDVVWDHADYMLLRDGGLLNQIIVSFPGTSWQNTTGSIVTDPNACTNDLLTSCSNPDAYLPITAFSSEGNGDYRGVVLAKDGALEGLFAFSLFNDSANWQSCGACGFALQDAVGIPGLSTGVGLARGSQESGGNTFIIFSSLTDQSVLKWTKGPSQLASYPSSSLWSSPATLTSAMPTGDAYAANFDVSSVGAFGQAAWVEILTSPTRAAVRTQALSSTSSPTTIFECQYDPSNIQIELVPNSEGGIDKYVAWDGSYNGHNSIFYWKNSGEPIVLATDISADNHYVKLESDIYGRVLASYWRTTASTAQLLVKELAPGIEPGVTCAVPIPVSCDSFYYEDFSIYAPDPFGASSSDTVPCASTSAGMSNHWLVVSVPSGESVSATLSNFADQYEAAGLAVYSTCGSSALDCDWDAGGTGLGTEVVVSVTNTTGDVKDYLILMTVATDSSLWSLSVNCDQ